MASSSGKKASNSRKKTTSSRSGKASSARKKANAARQAQRDYELFREIGLIVLFVAMVLLFLCHFGVIGPVGNAISGALFGLFGWTAYVLPPACFIAAAFWLANEGSPTVMRKMISGFVLFLMVGIAGEVLAGHAAALDTYDIKALFAACREEKNGGGVVAGSLAYFSLKYLETVGTVLVVLLCSAICIILMTEKLFLNGIRERGERMREHSRENSQMRKEIARKRQEEQYQERENRRQFREEQQESARASRRRSREEQQDSARASRRELQEEQRYSERENRKDSREENPYQAREAERMRRREEKRRRLQEKEDEKLLRMNKKAVGVTIDTSLEKPAPRTRDDIHEITLDSIGTAEEAGEAVGEAGTETAAENFDYDRIHIRSTGTPTKEGKPVPAVSGAGAFREVFSRGEELPEEEFSEEEFSEEEEFPEDEDFPEDEEFPGEEEFPEEDFSQKGSSGKVLLSKEAAAIPVYSEATGAKRPVSKSVPEGDDEPADAGIHKDIRRTEQSVPKKYMFPPISLLQKGADKPVDSSRELRETAMHLQQTLATFGVKVTITDISQGPSVTRYEMQPEQGVKVSKIVGLSDDIKLNLAATDIRIEAPIPGKAAVGIEVPNKENMTVALRDLLESREFKEFPSNIAFAVGKDIAGQVVVADIAKMPHMLIAGSTGSGKSVCINTLIMSILYKAHPEDVKLIMVDPKVVELSMYNGIPHLLIPVVTDPKKASAALHWGVSEMDDRYRKFAELNVRDLKGYNRKVDAMKEEGREDVPARLPQIVIIVDELADLMMVCPGEVEESICRLAQLARAAGIHLIIATQRPSVDVITGLIKANMPSRVAFAVSSGVDSRTILDMVGAERLLGKGDMLFYPQGYSKPARIQGAFVSDKEVSDVVDFLKNQAIGNVYAPEVEEKIKNMGSASGAAGGGEERDEYFAEAGRFIIERDKASIGMLQRALKIGFNRAARIMDQLAEYGVVGEEEGTKPRKILMSEEQFEQLLEEI